MEYKIDFVVCREDKKALEPGELVKLHLAIAKVVRDHGLAVAGMVRACTWLDEILGELSIDLITGFRDNALAQWAPGPTLESQIAGSSGRDE